MGPRPEDAASSAHPTCPAGAVLSCIAGYALHWDSRRSDEFCALFADDGVLEFEDPTGSIVLRSRAGIAQFAEERWSELGGRTTCHVQGASAVKFVSVGVARVQTPVVVVHAWADGSGSPTIHRTGVYYDELRQHGGSWRFASRRLSSDLVTKTSDDGPETTSTKEASR